MKKPLPKIAYKLTGENMQTHGGFQWELGKWYEIADEDKGRPLCSQSWFHLYSDPLLAVILNPIHARFGKPRLFKAEYDGETADDAGLKMGATRVRLIREIQLPDVDINTRCRYAILCVLEIGHSPSFVAWAKGWLSGEDRTADSATPAGAGGAGYARSAAAYAAHADAGAVGAEWAVAHATATAAADAADVAAIAGRQLPLAELAKQAVRDEAEYQRGKHHA